MVRKELINWLNGDEVQNKVIFIKNITTTSTTTTSTTLISSSARSSEPSSKEDEEWLKTMEVRYATTNSRIMEVCQKYNMDTKTKTKLRRTSWLVDTRHRLAYCWQAKVGSTTWMYHFNDLLPIDERPWKPENGHIRGNDGVRPALYSIYHRWFSLNRKRMRSGESFSDLLKKDNITVFTFVVTATKTSE